MLRHQIKCIVEHELSELPAVINEIITDYAEPLMETTEVLSELLHVYSLHSGRYVFGNFWKWNMEDLEEWKDHPISKFLYVQLFRVEKFFSIVEENDHWKVELGIFARNKL